jgi:hypothetical protein
MTTLACSAGAGPGRRSSRRLGCHRLTVTALTLGCNHCRAVTPVTVTVTVSVFLIGSIIAGPWLQFHSEASNSV